MLRQNICDSLAPFFRHRFNHRLASIWVALHITVSAGYTGAESFEPETTTRPETTQNSTQEIQPLSLHQTVRTTIASSATHLYRVEVSSGQYVRLLVEARDIELAIKLLDQNHRGVQEIRNRRFGPTPLSFLSGGGICLLEVRSLEQGGYEGRYELKIDRVGAALSKERRLMAAEKLIANADRLRDEWKSESLLQSIEKYEKARKFLSGIESRREEAYALKSIGDVYATLSQNQKSLDSYNKALHLSRAMGDVRLEIESLNDLAGISIDLGYKSKTLEYCQQARTLSKQAGYIEGQARSLNNEGGLLSYLQGEKEKALKFFNEALELLQTTGDRRGRAQSLSNLGYTYADLGNLKSALSCFGEALDLWRAVKDRRGEASMLAAFGVAHTSVGEMQQAIEKQNKAYQLFRIMGDGIGEAVTLNGLAYVYDSLGERHQALELYRKALQLHRKTGRRSGEAVTLGLIGEIYESLGDKQKALDYHYRKLEITGSWENRRAEAYTRRDIGVVFDSLGNQEKALEYYNQALSLSRVSNDPRGEANALNSIGFVYDRQGQKEKAKGLYYEALDLYRKTEDRAGEISTLHNIARCARDLGNLAEAYDQGKTLLNITESVRARVANHDLKASYFASAHKHYELMIDVLMRLHKRDATAGYADVALEASERARGRSLLDLLNEARTDIRQGIDAALLQKERDLQQTLNSKAERQIRLLSENHTEEQASAMKAEIADIAKQYEDTLASIRASSPGYAALTQAATVSVSEIQRQLFDDDTMLLEYSLGDERSYLWAVTRSSISTFELPGRARIEDITRRLYESLGLFMQARKKKSASQRIASTERARVQFSEAAKELSGLLFAPLNSLLGSKRLLIVADGAIQYAPFAALPDPRIEKDGQPMVVNHEIVSLPSVSVLSMIRKEVSGRRPAPRVLAVLADPVFGKDDPRVDLKKKGGRRARRIQSSALAADQKKRSLIPFSPSSNSERVPHFQRLPSSWLEANAITEIIPQSLCKRALGFEANTSTATSPELQQYQIVHFATHSLIYGVHPQLYGIVLSLIDERGNPQDGFLRLNAIYNLKLPAELVVLSACQTAVGKEIKGEGLVGLTRGFMYAGAARVVASLWDVEDRASAELMKFFYQAMMGRKLRPAAALREAQIAMWKHSRWSFPYYWAAFLVQGEWQ